MVASGGSDLPDGVVHTGPICTGGTACPSGTRNLAEYSSFTVGPDGNFYMAFAEDKNSTSQVGAAQTDFVKEEAGPSFLAPSPGSVTGNGAIQGTTKLDHFKLRVYGSSSGLRGSLAYLDQGSSVMLSSAAINALKINGDGATISGTGTYTNGLTTYTVSFTATVLGDQPQGAEDAFSITLSNGYSASGYLSAGRIAVNG